MNRYSIVKATIVGVWAAGFALLALAWALAPKGIPATSASQLQAVAEQSAPAYSDTELQSFAEAALEVKRIKDEYMPRLEAADTADEEEQVKEEASKEMVHAVEERGLSVQKYHEILMAALLDDAVAGRVGKYLSGTRV